jgi:hypothetical protein
VLCYEIYTLVYDQALLIAEQALRDRFLDYHRPAMTFADERGDPQDRHCGRRWLRAGDRLPEGQQVLLSRPRRWPSRSDFSGGMLSDLTRWARRLGLLCGPRHRKQELLHAKLRNNVAHPSAHLARPIEAAPEMRAVAEVIN